MKDKKFDIKKPKVSLGKARDWMMNHRFPPGILFIAIGIISTTWFLIRVIPKPSRAAYPCMRVAAPLMSGLILYLLSVAGIIAVSRKTRLKILNVRFLSTGLLTFGIVVAMAITPSQNINSDTQDSNVKLGPDDGPNKPIGTALGNHPGRVVWSWNPNATNENCTTNFETKDWYWKPQNIDKDVVGNMFSNAILKLTGESTIPDSWDLLFRYHNNRKNKKDSGYTKGEKIFLKINQGTSRWLLSQEDKDNGYYYPLTLKEEERRVRMSLAPTETNPYVVLEILRELVNESGINQSDIAVGDPMSDIYGHNYDIWYKEFPEVIYIDKFSDKYGRTLISTTQNDLVFYSDKSQSDKLYDIIENANYLINVANLKPHAAAGISLTAKNHFGSQGSETAAHLHYSLIVPRGSQPTNGGYHKYRVLVDLMGSRYLGQNTLIYIVDGLFGGGSNETMGPVKYFMTPFNNDWSNSLFLSQDQVALESVCYDFLRTEWDGSHKHNDANNRIEIGPNWNGVDDYLHQAAESSNWPKGITYDPDNSGKPIPSLGTHEHWNSADKKQYSRNMGKNKGIELVSIPDTLVKNNRP